MWGGFRALFSRRPLVLNRAPHSVWKWWGVAVAKQGVGQAQQFRTWPLEPSRLKVKCSVWPWASHADSLSLSLL